MLHQTRSKVSLAPSYQTLDPNTTTSSYQVGKGRVSFVEPVQLHRHLRLLGAFSLLRRKVESSQYAGIEDSRAKWTVFAHFASYRYELYVKEVVAAGQGTVSLPPLDVVMVFHTHLLNPTVFAEDKTRTFPELDLLSDRLLTQFVDSIDPNTFEHSPTNDEISNWQNRTSTPFDPLEAFAASSGRTIICPQTGDEIHVPWINSEGTGFAQEGFQVASPNGSVITHESLGIAKLSQDLFELKSNPKRGIARTMLNEHNALSSGASSLSLKISSKFLDLPIIANSRSWQDIGVGLEWKRDNAFKLIAHGVGGTKQFRLINEILEGYTTGSPFSIDLAFATLRQANFIEKMSELGWASSEWLSTPPEQNEILLHCVARYHAFMDLLSSSFSLFAVPTLDIDLAWHTHQLQSSYRIDTAQAVGRAIDHNDKVEETDLGYGFDDTAKLWEERFKVPYHYCGCPLPQTSTSDKALNKFSSSKLGARFGLSSSSSPTTTTGLSQPPSAHLATHSSEHNSFILTHHPDAQRRRKTRQDNFGDRKKKEDKKREKELKKGNLGGGEEEIERRKLDHELFFLRPVPLFEKFGEDGHPVSGEGVPVSANQAGSNKSKGSCGGSARDGISASVGSCGAASGVFLVAGPTGGGNLAALATGGFSAIAASGVAGGMVSSGM